MAPDFLPGQSTAAARVATWPAWMRAIASARDPVDEDECPRCGGDLLLHGDSNEGPNTVCEDGRTINGGTQCL